MEGHQAFNLKKRGSIPPRAIMPIVYTLETNEQGDEYAIDLDKALDASCYSQITPEDELMYLVAGMIDEVWIGAEMPTWQGAIDALTQRVKGEFDSLIPHIEPFLEKSWKMLQWKKSETWEGMVGPMKGEEPIPLTKE